MWHGFRSATREHVAAGGDAGRVVAAAKQTFTALGGKVLDPVSYSSGDADFRAILTQVRAQKPDAIFATGGTVRNQEVERVAANSNTTILAAAVAAAGMAA